ncbi:arsenate reductase [Colletotrichum tofieldiae]|uniref:CDC25-like phosphatase YCH1 n=1 Tax=Colletotrichum liriopes TaxID=708192 RepID=A0AA37H2F0_9PEZI|nr:CDC25-like phosphatase YCH1 [Colletotrichum liriopes]GKT64172.1 arsenate reductase [Colletotrichum tofieldiae]GKT74125.1 arsenate reductase [Colletotrichum tofieldiae]GKT97155.1 arsenate reductase [Colletotrichum tofieldiae]
MAEAAASTEPPPWWAAFPAPKAKSPDIEADEVMGLLEAQAAAGKDTPRDFLLVDVRRNDFEGGTIATSINFPAQSLYQTRPIIHQLCKQAGIKRVIFYCGSSNGRGPRSANWLQDYFDEVGETGVQSVILKGGIKGWVRKYGSRKMDWYDEKAWVDVAK